MFSEEFLQILRCPLNHGRVLLADEALVARVNAAITAGQVQNRSGGQVDKVLEAGLVDEARTVLYPVHGGVPSMLVDEAIPLPQLDEIQSRQD